MKSIVAISLFMSLLCKNQKASQQMVNDETKETFSQKVNISNFGSVDQIDTLKLVVGKIDYASSKVFILVKDQKIVSKPLYLDVEVFEHFKKMQADAKKDGISIKIISGVRNFEDQKRIWERKWLERENIKDKKERVLDILKYSSMPMTSRHHWGTDIDINSLDNNYFNCGNGLKTYSWMIKNAKKYGFQQVYTNKRVTKRTGYEEEKWHYSYLPKASKYLDFYNDNLTNSDIHGFLGSEHAINLDIIKLFVIGVTLN